MERDVQHRSFRTSSRTNAVLAAGKGCRIAQDDQLFLVEEVTGPHVEPLNLFLWLLLQWEEL